MKRPPTLTNKNSPQPLRVRGILARVSAPVPSALLRGLVLLGTLSLAQAQISIPAVPPAPGDSAAPAPSPEPVPVQPAEPLPAPAPEPEPVPAPAPEPVPAPPVTPTPPTTPAKPVAARGPLLIQVKVNFPALVAGKKTTVPWVQTLSIPSERAATLRQRGIVTQSLQADLDAFLQPLTLPRDARFEQRPDGQWVVLQRNGLKVDREATRAALAQLLSEGRSGAVNVVVTGQVAPGRTLDFFASRGITTFYATGATSYAGSSAARVKNIHVGATNFRDRLFEGNTFSFNQFVGPVTARNGYVTGLVIAGEQTVDGVGGGICQVSTTAFRTLYGAGLRVLQRQNHSYQVFYYDPQGLDATIYQPQLDLKFANDTGGALWFQTEWDDRQATLAITVFGKARDFQVMVDAPRTLKTTPAPKDRLIYDASLAKGERKQVDWAAPGATIEVTRRFVRNGQTFQQDTLRSVYRPWPNIFRVGTKG